MVLAGDIQFAGDGTGFFQFVEIQSRYAVTARFMNDYSRFFLMDETEYFCIRQFAAFDGWGRTSPAWLYLGDWILGGLFQGFFGVAACHRFEADLVFRDGRHQYDFAF